MMFGASSFQINGMGELMVTVLRRLCGGVHTGILSAFGAEGEDALGTAGEMPALLFAALLCVASVVRVLGLHGLAGGFMLCCAKLSVFQD